MLEVKGLHKSFGNTMVLQDINLQIAQGEIAAVLGPSGSGKTTLLRCLNYLEKADGGMMIFDDEAFSMRDISRRDIARVRQKTAFVFQNYNLFANKTALENVTEGLITARKMPKQEAVQMAQNVLDKVGLANRYDYYPISLSGGQQQRVAIARALVTKPKIIFFDEPTSALDLKLVEEVFAIIKNLADSGIAVVLVTHEWDFARKVASKIIFMENGQIIETNTAEQFFQGSKNERAELFLRMLNKKRMERCSG